MVKLISIFIYLNILCSCGRHDNAYIVNNTNDTILVELTLQDSITKERPDNYFWTASYSKVNDRKDSLRGVKESVVSFDIISNLVILKLNPKDMIGLGTVRLDTRRSDYKSWEFTEVKIIGNNFEYHAKDNGIMSFVKEETHLLTPTVYYFTIGNK